MAEPDEPSPATPVDSWQRLGVTDWKLALAVATPVTVALTVWISIQVASIFSRSLPLWVRIVGIIIAAVIGVGLTILIARWRTPQAHVNTARRLIRTRTDTIEWSELDLAELMSAETKTKRTLVLVLRSGKTFRAPILLRTARGRTIDETTQRLAAEVISGSSIAMPVSKDDPTGRFARFNFRRTSRGTKPSRSSATLPVSATPSRSPPSAELRHTPSAEQCPPGATGTADRHTNSCGGRLRV